MEKIIALIIFVIIMTVTPGPNNILLAVSGSKFGFRKSLTFVFGIVIGLSSQVVLFSLGLGVVFNKYPYIQDFLKIPGVLYILYLAYKIGFSENSNKKDSSLEKPLTIFKGTLFQYLNPKALLMTLTTATLYSKPGDKYLTSILFIVIIFIVITPCTTSLWAIFGTIIKRLTSGSKSIYINRTLGIVTALSAIFIIK